MNSQVQGPVGGHFTVNMKVENVDLSMFLNFYYKKVPENGLDTLDSFKEFNQF